MGKDAMIKCIFVLAAPAQSFVPLAAPPLVFPVRKLMVCAFIFLSVKKISLAKLSVFFCMAHDWRNCGTTGCFFSSASSLFMWTPTLFNMMSS